jgi:hypothetical protein
MAYAAEQHFRFESDTYTYEITFDDSRISLAETRRLAILSPWVDFSPRLWIGFESSRVNGKDVVDKTFMAPELELCVEEPAMHCTRNEDVPDEAFLQNAARNLQKGAEELEELRKEPVPSELEPVRAYLAESLRRSLGMESARYEYLKSGNLEPMRHLLCDVCSCANETSLLQLLSTATDPRQKLAIARFQWHNEVLKCEREGHDPAYTTRYPVQAWERFIVDYRITEHRRFHHVE